MLGFGLATAGVTEEGLRFARLATERDRREPGMVIFARLFPNMQRLRDDPRFADVLRRLALPQS